MDFNTLALEDIKRCYTFNSASDTYHCLICGQNYEMDEVFPIDGRFYTAERMVKQHIYDMHGAPLKYLLSLNKKLTTVTDNQKEILLKMAVGKNDKDIAFDFSISPSTVRHLRFTMKEKARQAKVFLALYELVFDKPTDLVPVHANATMVDDRYITTELERKKILFNHFESLNPPKLKIFSSKEKKKLIILRQIADYLNPDYDYTEIKLNDVLKDVYDDFATIRRYLVEYGFMTRTKDGNVYRIKR